MKCRKCWIAAAILCAVLGCTALAGCGGGETTPAVPGNTDTAVSETVSDSDAAVQDAADASDNSTASQKPAEGSVSSTVTQKPAGETGTAADEKDNTPVVSSNDLVPDVPASVCGTYRWASLTYEGRTYTLEELVQELKKENNALGLDQISEGNEAAALAQMQGDGITLYEDATGQISLRFLTDGLSICTWKLEGSDLILHDLGGTSVLYAPLKGNVITLSLNSGSGEMVLTFEK